MYTYMHPYLYVYTYACICMCICIYIYIYSSRMHFLATPRALGAHTSYGGLTAMSPTMISETPWLLYVYYTPDNIYIYIYICR